MSIIAIETNDAPKAGGHYAQGVRAGDLLYVSGQLPVTPQGDILSSQPFEDQARQAIQNMLNVAAAGGCGPAQIAKVTAYIVDIEHWPAFNRVYAELMGESRPARAIVPVPELHYGVLAEVECVAYVAE
jgi:2-iminobutanoate/2-iminopropanoate deaminase